MDSDAFTGEDRFLDIGFAEMRPDPLPAIERLYGWLGVQHTDQAAERMRIWWDTNPADKRGADDCSPEQCRIDGLRAQLDSHNFGIGLA